MAFNILLSRGEAMKREAFFTGWTCKEALIKATGEGLSHPLREVEAPLNPDEPSTPLKAEEDPKGASLWSMHSLKVAPGFAAAFAVEEDCPNVLFRQWQRTRRGAFEIRHNHPIMR